LIAVDHEGGRVQRFRSGFTPIPAMATLGEIFDREPQRALHLATETGWLMAAELRAVGVDFSFAPVLDLYTPTSRVIRERAFHAEPGTVARLAQAFLRGMHGAGMAAVGKHTSAVAGPKHTSVTNTSRPASASMPSPPEPPPMTSTRGARLPSRSSEAKRA
jgi:beta-N-acetylhexosaminidase